ncbi:MAG: FtsX-like permease family protein [Thermoanaerobaculia bacterium]
MTFVRTALRNVGRNRRRTLLTAGIVAVGFTALTLAGGFVAQSFDALAEGTIRSGVGHLQIGSPELFSGSEAETLEHGLAGSEALAARVADDPEVRQVLRRIDFFGLAGTGGSAIPFVGVGVEPGREEESMDTPELVAEGRWLGDAEADEAVLGGGLARALGVEPGGWVTLFAMTVDGVLNALDVQVAGIASLPVRELDDRYLALPLASADRLLQAEGTVSKLVVLLDDRDRAAAVGERLKGELGAAGTPVDVREWRQLAEFYRQVRTLYLGIFGFLGAVLLAIVLLAAANSMLMVTTERTREIGTLRALGMKPRGVVRLFTWEGLAVAALGCLAGALLSLALREIVNRSHLTMPAPPGVAHPVELFIRFYPEAYGIALVGMLLAALLATWWPARRAARQPIVEALAHV